LECSGWLGCCRGVLPRWAMRWRGDLLRVDVGDGRVRLATLILLDPLVAVVLGVTVLHEPLRAAISCRRGRSGRRLAR